MNKIFFTVIFLLLSVSIIAGNSQFREFEFFDGNINKTIKIVINDTDWQHINEGEQTSDYYFGGHNYNIFFKKHVKNNPNASVFFDTQMNCYIVSSEKGDGLQTIIKNLNERKQVKYHSLFPGEILTKELIFNAFEKAFRESNDQSIKESKVLHGKKKLFYTTINGLKICGYFLNNKKNKNTKNTYTITSFFPDVYWHYRLDIQEQPFISMARFMEWSTIKQKWIGYENGVLDDQIRYEPDGKKIILNNQFFNLNNSNKLVDIGMRIRNKIITDLQSNKLTDVDVFQYFFKDSLMPTEEEWNNMAYLIKFFTEFKCLKHKNKCDISHVKLFFKKYLSSNDKSMKDVKFNHDNKKYICKKELLGTNIINEKIIVNGLNFAEELVKQMLLINNDVYSMINSVEGFFLTQQDIDKICFTSKYFTDNFLNRLLDNDLLTELKENKLSFEFRLIDKINKYSIEIIYPLELTAEAIEKSDHQSFMICIFEGDKKFPYKFSIKEFNN